MRSSPPAAASTSRRTSMQPPAAAAVLARVRPDPPERVELREEVHERRDDPPLPAGFRPQQGHLGDQGPVVRDGGANQAGHGARIEGDVGIGEQQ
jgi:hypothetical protein